MHHERIVSYQVAKALSKAELEGVSGSEAQLQQSCRTTVYFGSYDCAPDLNLT